MVRDFQTAKTIFAGLCTCFAAFYKSTFCTPLMKGEEVPLPGFQRHWMSHGARSLVDALLSFIDTN